MATAACEGAPAYRPRRARDSPLMALPPAGVAEELFRRRLPPWHRPTPTAPLTAPVRRQRDKISYPFILLNMAGDRSGLPINVR